MAMRVVLPSDVYRKDTIVGTIFGPPGLRKTTLGFTADRPLLLDFDGGVHRASYRKAFVPVETWEDVMGMEKSDFEGYATAVVDTAGRALDVLGDFLKKKDPKNSNKSGGLSLQGFGALKSEFSAWLRKLRSYGLNVLLILHSEEKQDGDQTTIRIDAAGASKQEIYKSSDFMGLISIDHEGTITLTMSPSDTAFGKNPANLPAQKFKTIDPSSTHMAKVFSMTLEKINAMTEEQREVSSLLEAFRVKVMEADGAEALTKLVAEAQALDERVRANAKRVLLSGATDRGFMFDKESGAFKAKAAPPAPAAPQTAKETQAALPEPGPAEDAPQEPGEPDKPAGNGSGGPKVKLEAVFAEKYPDVEARTAAFKKADAHLFFKKKLKDARSGIDALGDIDAAIMLAEIQSGALSI